jgi:hypothetical protein
MSLRGYNISELIDLYDSVGLETRNMKFLARWFCNMFDFSYLPSVDLEYKDQLVLDKLKLSIFNILVDDLADNYIIRNKELFEKAARIPWDGHNSFKNKYLNVTKKIWLDFSDSLKLYPRYQEFKEIFYFDLDQFLDSIKYSMLINSVGLDNPLEIKTYPPQNMQVLLFLNMDLMCSPSFDIKELGKIRPILIRTQNLLHLAHVISTYPREIEELDFSSPMISMGLSEGVIEKEDVIKNPETTLENLRYFEPYLKNLAEQHFEKIKDQIDTVKTVDIEDFYERVRRVYDYFLERPYYWKLNEMEEQIGKTCQIAKTGTIKKYDASIKWIRMQ